MANLRASGAPNESRTSPHVRTAHQPGRQPRPRPRPESRSGRLGSLARCVAQRAARPGGGYLYQRRWRAWWITTVLSSGWFLLGALLEPNPTAIDPRSRLVGLGGLLLLAAVSAGEAFLAARRARMD